MQLSFSFGSASQSVSQSVREREREREIERGNFEEKQYIIMACLFIHFFVLTLLRDHKLKAFDNNLAKVFNALYRLFVIYLTQGPKEMMSSTIVLIYSIQGCLKNNSPKH